MKTFETEISNAVAKSWFIFGLQRLVWRFMTPVMHCKPGKWMDCVAYMIRKTGWNHSWILFLFKKKMYININSCQYKKIVRAIYEQICLCESLLHEARCYSNRAARSEVDCNGQFISSLIITICHIESIPEHFNWLWSTSSCWASNTKWICFHRVEMLLIVCQKSYWADPLAGRESPGNSGGGAETIAAFNGMWLLFFLNSLMGGTHGIAFPITHLISPLCLNVCLSVFLLEGSQLFWTSHQSGNTLPLIHTAALTTAVHCCSDHCSALLLWPLLYTAALTTAVHCCSDHCSTLLLWPLLHTAALTTAPHCCSDHCPTLLLWPLLRTAALTTAPHSVYCHHVSF